MLDTAFIAESLAGFEQDYVDDCAQVRTPAWPHINLCKNCSKSGYKDLEYTSINAICLYCMNACLICRSQPSNFAFVEKQMHLQANRQDTPRQCCLKQMSFAATV